MPTKTFAIKTDAKVATLPAGKKHHNIKVRDNEFYIPIRDDAKAGIDAPEPGDERVSFEYAPPMTCSVVAKQQGQELVPYVAPNGNSVALARAGRVPAATMLKLSQADSENTAWGMRLFIGLGLTFALVLITIAAFLAKKTRKMPPHH